jgi:hypothetical protein
MDIEVIDDQGRSRIYRGCWISKADAKQHRIPTADQGIYAGRMELRFEYDDCDFVDEKGSAQRSEEARVREAARYEETPINFTVEVEGQPFGGWKKTVGQRVRQQPRSQHVEEGFGHVDAPDPNDREVRERRERQEAEAADRRAEENQRRQRQAWEREQARKATAEVFEGFEDFFNAFRRGFGQSGIPPRPTRPISEKWREILNNPVDIAAAEAVYKKLTLERHPDRPGGSHEAMVELNNAIADARKAFRR